MTRSILIPQQFALNINFLKNPIVQLQRKEQKVEVDVHLWQYKRVNGESFSLPEGRRILVVPKKLEAPEEFSEVLQAPSGIPSSEDELFQQGPRSNLLIHRT